MEMISEQLIEASRESVWLALNDTVILQKAMPGCESFEETGENTFEAKLITKIGPVKARFKFDVTLSDLDPPGVTPSAVQDRGCCRVCQGAATVTLSEQDGTKCLPTMCRQMWWKAGPAGGPVDRRGCQKMADDFLRILNNWWAPKLNRLRIRQISWRGHHEYSQHDS